MGKVKDITGEQINGWTVIKECGRDKGGGAMFLCQCVCGSYRVVEGRSIRAGTSKNCGCARKTKTVEKHNNHIYQLQKGTLILTALNQIDPRFSSILLIVSALTRLLVWHLLEPYRLKALLMKSAGRRCMSGTWSTA